MFVLCGLFEVGVLDRMERRLALPADRSVIWSRLFNPSSLRVDPLRASFQDEVDGVIVSLQVSLRSVRVHGYRCGIVGL